MKERSLCIVAFRGAWRLSHMDIGYRWSGSVITVLHFGGGRIERLDLGTPCQRHCCFPVQVRN